MNIKPLDTHTLCAVFTASINIKCYKNATTLRISVKGQELFEICDIPMLLSHLEDFLTKMNIFQGEIGPLELKKTTVLN